jgi:hypothetical protein
MYPTYTIDPVRRRVCIVYCDQPKFAELQVVLEAIFHEPDYGRGFDFLIDRSMVRETASVAFAQQVADFITSHPLEFTDVRWAVVVADAANFGMARMIHGMAGIGFSGQVFFDRPSAERWLREGECVGHLAYVDTQHDDGPAHASA